MKRRLNDSQRIRSIDFIRDESSLANRPVGLGKSVSNSNVLSWQSSDFQSHRFRIDLYRFLRNNIPILSSCIWTWSRLSSAPGNFRLNGNLSDAQNENARGILDKLFERAYPFEYDRVGGLDSFLPMLFGSLFTDGAFS